MQGIRLDLRLPGQWEDAESGLHFNDFRYYDPERGRYLSPDPLGLAGGLNAYAYVGNNPVGYGDPLGLILFAFDGTGNNSNPDSLRIDHTNVALMYALYDQTVIGQELKEYQRGIGSNPQATTLQNWVQQGLALEARTLIDAQLRNLDRYLESLSTEYVRANAIPIDVIGFSRGAAQARSFANTVLSRYRAGVYGEICLQARFLGLFDTVAQFGLNGSGDGRFDMTIAPEWHQVSQAYALNEHHPLFPLQSIRDAPAPHNEQGFVGAHADIGGGYNVTGETFRGDLSDVALNWMISEATRAGVIFTELPQEYRQISNPVLHDQRNNGGQIIPTNPSGLDFGYRYARSLTFVINPETGETTTATAPPDDRQVRFSQGDTPTTARSFGISDPTYGPILEWLTRRPPNWERRPDDFGYRDNCAGLVDMQQYRSWLEINLELSIQAAPDEGTGNACQPR